MKLIIQPLVLTCLFFCYTSTYAQREEKIDSLINLAQQEQYQNPEKAEHIFETTLIEAEKIDYKRGIGLCQKGLGISADVLDAPERSIFYYKQAFKTFIENNDTLDAYKVRFNEAMIYRQLGMYQQAETLFQEAADIFRKYEFQAGVVLCSVNYGIMLYDQRRTEEALKVFKDVKNINEKSGTAGPETYGNIGNCYVLLNEFDSAEFYCKKAYLLANEAKNYDYQISNGTALGSIYYKQKKWTEAIEVLEGVVALANESKIIKKEMSALQYLHQSYYETQAYKLAYDNLLIWASLKDSTGKEDFLLSLSEKEAVIENEKSKSEIQSLKEKEKLAELEKEKDIVVFRGLLIGGFLIIIIAVLILVQSIKRRKSNKLLHIKNELIEEQHQEIKDSINYAQQIQAAILTSESEWLNISKEHFIFYQPKDVVSGDFFWAYHNHEKNISFWVAADCTGHGVPGAFMSMLGVGLLNEIIIENGTLDSAEILNQLRSKIIKALASTSKYQRKDGMDLAICCWNKNTNKLQFSGANNPLFLIRETNLLDEELSKMGKENAEGKSIIEIKGDKMPVGAYTEKMESFSSYQLDLKPNDILCTFSDGFPDQFGGEKGKKYKYKQFREDLLATANLPLHQMGENLKTKFTSWRGDFEQVDDICVIGIKIP